MTNFIEFKMAVHQQFKNMATQKLFVTAVEKDALWETYLKSFPEGTNPIFRERTEHDCQCCKQFIRACGNVICINDDLTIESIWDINIGGHYQVVADALSTLVKNRKIANIFLHYQKKLGTDFNLVDEENIIREWVHFYFELPNKFVNTNSVNRNSIISNYKANKQVFGRGLEEITKKSLQIVTELIQQKSIYRGEEHLGAIQSFTKLKKRDYLNLETPEQISNFTWLFSKFTWLYCDKPGARIKNTAIGTLLIDISEGMVLDQAVKKFESKVAPENYKRPTALISPMMIEKAQKEITELGFIDSLPRRNAVKEDITINNVLFANRDTKKAMNVFEEMAEEASVVDLKKLKKIEEVDINHFIATILPQVNSVELLFENKLEANLMSLVAPVNKNAACMLKWNNNFSWAYKGEVADSMRQRVKKAGGTIDGDLRFSIQWNDGDNNQNDFDAHSVEPRGNEIYYPDKGRIFPSSGKLDVDIQRPGNKVAVENIVYFDRKKMPEGDYTFLVHNYAHNGGKTGFTAEIEFDGQIRSFTYNKELREGERVIVAVVNARKNGFAIKKSLKSSMATKSIWDVTTGTFQKVSMIMNSPNHWDGNQTGNKHYFFMLEGCNSGEPVRGFFNEFLKEDLTSHRKVFETLGSKMKTELGDQLSGLGFSSTKRNSIICKVSGTFTRTLKVNF